MNEVSKRIMEIFRKAKVGADNVLKTQVVQEAIRSWDRPAQGEAQKASNKLMDEGYLQAKEGWYVLTQKGYDYVYEGYSIEDTKRLILDEFERKKVGASEGMMVNSLISLKQNAGRFDMDNFAKAMQEMANDAWIKESGHMLLLTEEGYKKVYRLG
jgi:wobble nucleotide-excising tRNase